MNLGVGCVAIGVAKVTAGDDGRDDVRAGIAAADAALALRPGQWRVLVNRAAAWNTLAMLEQVHRAPFAEAAERALADADAAARLNSATWRAPLMRVDALETLGRVDEAIAACDAALARWPDQPEVRGHRAGLRERHRR